MMKFSVKKVVGLILAAVMTLGVSTAAFAEENAGITVNGTGGIEVDPDTAIIYANIETSASEAEEAQKKNNELVTCVTEAMIKAGIAEDKILTEYNYVHPSYKHDADTDETSITGYIAYTTLSFKTNDVDNAGKYLDTAVAAGATGSRVSFTLENSSVYYAAALKEAVNAAKDSAKAIADACGVTLGTVKSVQETSSNYYVSEYSYESAEAEVFSADSSANGVDTSIKYDKISVTARISITYNIQ